MAARIMRFAFTGVCFCVFLVGLRDFLLNYEDNGCEMTYMYEYPEFVNVKLDESVRNRFPKYRLYLYGEGYYAQSLRSAGYAVSGVPVLFIAGSAGTHSQVRSPASVALRRALDQRSEFHFNYFAVDLNEEFSGLFGGVLMEQTEFVAECIKKIRKMYSKTTKTPKSVILMGHSMGGLVARGVFMLPDFDAKSVHTILSFATPHLSPVLSLDPAMSSYYHFLDDYWRRNINDSLSQVVLVSVGGGFRDLQVRNGLTKAPHYGAPERIMSTSSMSVPKSWLATDHRAIVWCNQLVLVTQRALFDLADKSTHRITDSLEERVSVLRHHFLQNPGSARPLKAGRVVLSDKVKVMQVNDLTFSVKQQPTQQPVYVHMDTSNREGRNFIATCRECGDSWVLGCTRLDDSDRCSEADDLSYKANLQPPERKPRKVIHVTSEELKLYQKIILVVPRTEWKVEIHAELYDVATRHLALRVPPFFEDFPESLYKFKTVLETSERGAIFYNLTIPYMETVRQAYKVHVRRRGCYDVAREHEEVLTYHTPWASEDVHAHQTSKHGLNMSLKLQSGRPASTSRATELHLYSDGDCLYTVEMMISIPEMVGQFLRYYLLLVPGFVVAHILLMLSWQLSSLETVDESNYWYLDLVGNGANPRRFLPFVVLPHLLLTIPEVRTAAYSLGMPMIDGHLLEQMDIWNLAIMPMVFFLSSSVAAVGSGAILIGVELVALVWGYLFKKWLSSDLLCSLGRMAEVLGLILALSAVMTSSAGLGLLLVAAINFVKVLLFFSCPNTDLWLKNRARVTYLLFLLSAALAVQTGPSLVTWLKHTIPHDLYRVSEDPWRVLACGYCFLHLIIALVQNERVYCHSSIWTYKSIHLLAVLIPLYAIKSLHYLPFLVTMATALLALRCMRSITRPDGRRRESLDMEQKERKQKLVEQKETKKEQKETKKEK